MKFEGDAYLTRFRMSAKERSGVTTVTAAMTFDCVCDANTVAPLLGLSPQELEQLLWDKHGDVMMPNAGMAEVLAESQYVSMQAPDCMMSGAADKWKYIVHRDGEIGLTWQLQIKRPPPEVLLWVARTLSLPIAITVQPQQVDMFEAESNVSQIRAVNTKQ